MLKRRNMIRPFTRHSNLLLQDSDHPLASPTRFTSTNPFLDALHGDDSETQPPAKQEYINQITPQISPTTNPFLSDTSTYSHAAFIPEYTDKSGHWKDNVEENKAAQQKKNIKDRIHKLYQQYSLHNNQQHLPHHRPRRPSGDHMGAVHNHSRRMSLDLFKIPFAWNRQRRVTCTASDLKRTITQGMPSFEKQQRNGIHTARDSEYIFPYPHTESDGGNTSSDEILKSSRYYPQEEEQIHYSDQQQENSQDLNQDQNSEPGLLFSAQAGFYDEYATHVPPLTSTTTERGPLEYIQDLQAMAPTCDETETLGRSSRRHSVFSDSIEDCPRLLALQRKQLQAEQDQAHQAVSDGVETHSDTYDTNQDLRAAAATLTLHPLERTWQPRPSLTRRESQSYAHDFMRESERWRLRPWTATSSTYAYSYSSSLSSPVSSPVHQRMFPHERDLEGQVNYTPNEEGFFQSQVDRPLDTQVYEQDYNEYGHNSGYDEPINHNEMNGMVQLEDRFMEEHDFSCRENECDRFYTDTMQWQGDNFVSDHEAKLESKQTRSQDILTRKATVAKKKLYKLLHHTKQRHDQPDRIHSDDEGDNHHHYEAGYDCDDGSGNGQSGNDSFRFTSSAYSFKSSLRARVRLAQTKTALRQVKRRISDAARTLALDANKATSSMTPLLRSQGSKCHQCDDEGVENVSESSIRSEKGIKSVAEER
ncbi:hypothetical protein BGZ51_005284 [Haplosporangium sp. Z 767]|nr:hypothetical protein BGZ51_005284 [Haplosporangium sp. Z 767]KAF9181873.1 hypothetical protein BGZ50_005257 [Haplosporangium sp. Z 11]